MDVGDNAIVVVVVIGVIVIDVVVTAVVPAVVVKVELVTVLLELEVGLDAAVVVTRLVLELAEVVKE